MRLECHLNTKYLIVFKYYIVSKFIFIQIQHLHTVIYDFTLIILLN